MEERSLCPLEVFAPIDVSNYLTLVRARDLLEMVDLVQPQAPDSGRSHQVRSDWGWDCSSRGKGRCDECRPEVSDVLTPSHY